jgi:hypothetical protein
MSGDLAIGETSAWPRPPGTCLPRAKQGRREAAGYPPWRKEASALLRAGVPWRGRGSASGTRDNAAAQTARSASWACSLCRQPVHDAGDRSADNGDDDERGYGPDDQERCERHAVDHAGCNCDAPIKHGGLQTFDAAQPPPSSESIVLLYFESITSVSKSAQ